MRLTKNCESGFGGVVPSTDSDFQEAFSTWRKSARKSTNYQLHPPIGRDDDIATNDSGNLRLPKMFEAVTRKGKFLVNVLSTSPARSSTLVSKGRWDRRSGVTFELEQQSLAAVAETEGPRRREPVAGEPSGPIEEHPETH